MKKRFGRRSLLIFAAILVAGCSAQGGAINEDLTKVHTFNAPTGVPLTVETGESLFVEGRYVEGEKISVTQTVETMIPGSMKIPFPIRIDPGELTLSKITSNWKYYCGDYDKVAASFPGLGVVIAQGDCVGIRISRDGQEKQWAVDNSIHNRKTTIWAKGLKESEYSTYEPVTASEPFSVSTMQRLIFDGYYGDQLHFTWEERRASEVAQKEFVFDFDGDPTVVGIKGNNFKVTDVDNVRLVYEWIKFD